MQVTSNRTGYVVHTMTGYQAFIPNKLPPVPPVERDDEMQYLLSVADRKLGRLDGITRILPNPELFLAMYVKKEAVLSSQIEGTQASLIDVLGTGDDDEPSEEKRNSVEDVVNYVHAMNYGLERLKTLPLSLRLIREIHAELIRGVRGSDKSPGEFRKTQNWIGPQGCTLATATFVPPPVPEMQEAMGELEKFLYDENFIPALIKIAMIHAQFETIHPFLDGNGRIGRLLITFWLCQQDILSQPLLYLSYYFKQNRMEYYDRLMNVRLHGDWENWIKFFLKGVAFTADEATISATAILSLKDRYTQELSKVAGNNNNYQRMLEYLFKAPIITRKDIADYLGITTPTAGVFIETFLQLGILEDSSPNKQRNKKYTFKEYMTILEKGT